MNWAKIKSIMICFLIFMNVFLLAFLTLTTLRENTVPKSVIDASVKILEKEGFKCDKAIIPDSYYVLPRLSAQFYSASSLSDLFFGKQTAFRTSGNSLVANEGKATLTVSGNYFLYENGYNADNSQSHSKIRRALQKAGIDMSGAVYDEKEGYFYFMYKSVNLFNMYIEAKLDSDGDLCYVSAQWPSKLSTLEEKKISFPESVLDIKNIFPEGGNISYVEAGYSLNHISGEKYVFVPTWRITTESGSKILE